MYCSTLGPKFLSVSLYDQLFSRYIALHILGFPTDSHVKISKCHKFCKTWPIAKKSNSLHSRMVSSVLIKFGWDPMKTVGEVAFWKSYNWKFCKLHWMTPNQTQGIGHQEYPTYMHCKTLRPKFSSVLLYD